MKLKYLIRLATVAAACNSLTTEAVSFEDASCGVRASASLGREKNSGTGQRNNYGLRATASLAREKNFTSHGIDQQVERRAASDIENDTPYRLMRKKRKFGIETTESSNDSTLRMLHVQKMTPAITASTTFSFSQERITNDGQFNSDSVNNLSVFVSVRNDNDNNNTDGLTILSVDTQTGDVKGLRHGIEGKPEIISVYSRAGSLRPTLRARTVVSHSERNFTCGALGHHEEPHDHLFSLRPHMRDFDTQGRESSQHDGFTINVLIAVDSSFIKKHGSTTEATKYINFLISHANAIYESEIDAHLNIVRVEQIDIMKRAKSLSDGLSMMRNHYEGTVRTRSGDDGEQINLVHALLGQDIGGGIAFIDSVCDSTWGVGLSSGLKGTMDGLDDDVFHDAHMVAHEIGHSLGAGHTFDAFKPPVDKCGNGCPAKFPLYNSATLMSYCNFCEGGLDNVAMTFGGQWDGKGSKFNVKSWDKSPQLVSSSISKDPQRVSHRIWSILSSKGECVRRIDNSPVIITPTPASPITTVPTLPSDAHLFEEQDPYKDPLKIQSNISTTVSPIPIPSNGPFSIGPDYLCGNDCTAVSEYMFSVKNQDSARSIELTGVSFEHRKPKSYRSVKLYKSMGSYLGKQNVTIQWMKIASKKIRRQKLVVEEFLLDKPIILTKGETISFHIKTKEDILLVGTKKRKNKSTDSNTMSVFDGSAVLAKLSGVILDDITGNGAVTYVLK